MPITDYHAKFIGHDLTRRRLADGAEGLTGAVASAQVDLNPHQVDAALFAFGSPLSKGVLLADEVGLGKTIEAGLVIAQRWAERRRRILIITPANLRKQWSQELKDKFFLDSEILESRSFNAALKSGVSRPFEPQDRVVVCSYQFARSKAENLPDTAWDLVVNEDVRDKLKTTNEEARASLGRYERALMRLTRQELGDAAEWVGEDGFRLSSRPTWAPGETPLGLYELPRRSGEAHFYRAAHPLGEAVLGRARDRALATAEVTFDLSGHPSLESLLQPFAGRSGWITVERLSVRALDRDEDHLLLAGLTDEGEPLHPDALR